MSNRKITTEAPPKKILVDRNDSSSVQPIKQVTSNSVPTPPKKK